MAYDPTSDPVPMYSNTQVTDQQRINDFEERWRYYHGDHPPAIMGKDNVPSKDNLTVNYCAMIVGKLVQFIAAPGMILRVKRRRVGLDQQVDDEMNPPPDVVAAQIYLDEAIQANKGREMYHHLEINGSVTGQLISLLRETEGEGFPREIVVNPSHLRVVANATDYQDISCFIFDYQGRDATGQRLDYRQVIELRMPREGEDALFPQDMPRDVGVNAPPTLRWIITDYERRWGQQEWTTTGTDLWPYAWPPVLSCQNAPMPNQFWGDSDLPKDILALQQSGINNAASMLNRIIRQWGSPRLVGKGIDETQAADIDANSDHAIGLPDTDQDLEILESKAANVKMVVDFFNTLVSEIQTLTHIPDVATGNLEHVGNLSGLGIQILYFALILRLDTKKATRDNFHRTRALRYLEMANRADFDVATLDVGVEWPNVLPIDKLQQAQILEAWRNIGASEETCLKVLGLDPALERKRRVNDRPTSYIQEPMGKYPPKPVPLKEGDGAPPQAPA